ncbi:gamma-glutamylcysteine synthetase [Olea europaea subsp. europaea]|uniref:Gamma-glutamylcysteine synthetase, partial n=1 Tax=Olea europaea subsp. europaea TaxID=158383 RepID=A0A8S0QM63_OLEEU|nr:gamma-glutamylcysteine synthetase [Olea europaea subsp. europaea]
MAFRDGLLKHIAQEVTKLAKDGLERRGYKETGFLNEMTEVVGTGVTPAEKLLELVVISDFCQLYLDEG